MRLVTLVSLWYGLIPNTYANTADIQAGERKSAICAGCHGSRGIAPSANFPHLAGQSTNYLIKQLQNYQQANSGRQDPMMTGFAVQLSEQDIQQLAAYYAAQPPRHPVSAVESDIGKRLYLGGDMARDIAACSACHGVHGQGLTAAGFPALSGQHALYTEQQLNKFKQGQRHNDPNNMMTDISRKLNAEEIAALAAYIATLTPPKAAN